MNNRYFLIFFIFSILSCQSNAKKKSTLPNIKTAKDLIKHSIAYHDPDGNWKNFKSNVHISTSLWKSNGIKEKSSEKLFFNNKNGVFKMHSIIDNIEFKGEIRNDTCYRNPVHKITKEQTIQFKRFIGCESITFNKNYYSYLIGLPMKLADTSAIVNDTIFERKYKGTSYNVVKVNYKPLDKNPSWYFYFSKENNAFQLCKFTSLKNENKGGEYIIYNKEKNIQGIKLKTQQVWLYNKPNLDTLAVDNLQFSSTNN